MQIQFIDPLSRGMARMKKALFKPFNLTKWFVVGFTAFLAGLIDTNGGGGGGSEWKDGGPFNIEELRDIPYVIHDLGNAVQDWIYANTGWALLIIVGIVIIITVILLLTWLSSRGKFMFLDNVVHDRAQVVKPWHDHARLGNSLFFWRLGFVFVTFAAFGLFFYLCIIMGLNIFDGDFTKSIDVLLIIGLALTFIALITATAYISLFLTDFIVPIMYINNIKTIEAWNKFLPLLTGKFFHFVWYGLLIFLLWILIVICLMFIGIFTCCIGFLVLIIPYIGSVVLLPISYTFRAYSLEFLEQFGDEFKIFPDTGEAADTVEVVEDKD